VRAVTIGAFDGIHLGHRQLFESVQSIAAARGLKPAVLTFDPHPATIVAPERAPKLITTLDERRRLLAGLGMDEVHVVPFTPALSLLTPEQFVRQILIEQLQTKAVIVGANFRFGHQQAGHIDDLERLGAQLDFTVHAAPVLSWRGRKVSSTAIRQAITSGNLSLANRLLGRPYPLRGAVVPGHGIGSKQTVPTLNLDTPAELLPAHGVYITRTRDLDSARTWNSITNIGLRPTFSGDSLTIETFLLDPFDGHTPAHIEVELLRRVREERKFPSPEALKAQIFADVSRAQAYFRRTAHLQPR
jgi:riboflavin kinase/FMN adenylyltransferase